MKWKIIYKIKGEKKVRTEIVNLAATGKIRAGASWKVSKEKENLDEYEFINAVPVKNEEMMGV